MPDEPKAWIGVDLDGTLAYYTGWIGIYHIGAPIPAMLDRVKQWLADGKTVKIFTARCHHGPEAVAYIQDWCERWIGQRLEVTATKDYNMIQLWDDRVVQVFPNTGIPVNTELNP